MPTVIYIDHAGERQELDVDLDNSVMMAAVYDGVNGIEGMCGGCLACATCHVYVDEAWAGKLPAMGDDEDTLLSQVSAERRPNSRLSCQITMTAALDGIIIHTPEIQ